MILAAPIVCWTLVTAPRLVELLFGADYLAAAVTLRVLAVAVLFLFVTALYGYLFSALDRQRFYTVASGLCLLVNVALDVALIPAYGDLGAAIATLLAETAFCVSGLWLLYRIGYRLPVFRVVGAPLALAAAISPLLMWAVTSTTAVLAAASVLYATFYLALVAITGTLGAEERDLLRSFFDKRAASRARLSAQNGPAGP